MLRSGFQLPKWTPFVKVLSTASEQRYGSTRAFISPSETRFGGKLLQIKRFLSLRDALQQLVESEEYTRFEFEDDSFAARLSGLKI